MIFILFAIVMSALFGTITRRKSGHVALFVFNLIYSYLALPVLAFGFGDIFIPVIVSFAIISIIEILLNEYGRSGKGHRRALIISGAITALVMISCSFFSSAMFTHNTQRQLIGKVQESVFSDETTPIDPKMVRTVDKDVALRLGEKLLGEDTALGSVATLGEPSIQKVGNGLYWVIPLNHSSFFRWLKSEGTHGYIKVSATNQRDVELVQEIEGKQIYLKYNKGGFFGEDIPRYLYRNGYATTGLMDYSFEVDDDGYPYWVITKYTKKAMFTASDTTGVLVLNAQTGDIKEYSIDDAPEWIDRIQPSDLVEEQINSWGKYVHGWWFQNTSRKDCLTTSPGISLVYGADGRSYWYTGVTSKGADESTVGFIMTDTRTKESRLYKQSGATETAAMESAQGKVQEKGYSASYPILYNVGGLPTYFLTLKDDAGLVKLMSFISVEHHQVVGVGENVSVALRMYKQALATSGNIELPDGVVEHKTLEGKILRLTQDKDGNYYLLVAGSESKVFVGNVDLSNEILVSKEGDLVKISYSDGESELVFITKFDNLDLSLGE